MIIENHRERKTDRPETGKKGKKMKEVNVTKKKNWTSPSGKSVEIAIVFKATKGEIVETYLDGYKGSYEKGFEKTEKAILSIDGNVVLEGFVFEDLDGKTHIRNGNGSNRLDDVTGGHVKETYEKAKKEYENIDWVAAEMARQRAIALGEVEYSDHVAKMNAMMRD